MSYKAIHLPVGYEVAIKADTDPDWIGLGVTKDAGSLEFTYDAIKVTGSQAEPVLNYIKNMVMNATFSLYQQELSNLNRIMSGATQYTTVAGVAVPGAVDSYTATNWAREVFIPFRNQNGVGTVPTSISVANPGALLLGTDYVVLKSGDKWGIMVLAARGNLSNTLAITYTYTPSAKRVLSAGSVSKDISPRQLRIRKQLKPGKYWTATIYSAATTSGLTFTMPRYDADEPDALEVVMEGQLDTTRSDLDMLFKIEDEVNITDI
ncbi:MAG: hypothetical protein C0436_00050 [Alphaproteobacteria bacterium]|nr:hypothetical protein [Alphaproteobacteria bacterium]